MATVTSKANGDWADATTWDSDPAIPANGDSVVIAHLVNMDYDNITAAIGLAALTINSGKQLYWTPGTLGTLHMDGNLTNNATLGLSLGNSGNQITLGAAGAPWMARIFFDGNFGVTGTGTNESGSVARARVMDYAASSADARHLILTNGMADLQAGDQIVVSQASVSDYGTIHTVTAYNSGTKEITVGVDWGRAITAGDMVILLTRAIRIEGTNSAALIVNGASTPETYGGVEWYTGNTNAELYTNRSYRTLHDCSFYNFRSRVASNSEQVAFTDCVAYYCGSMVSGLRAATLTRVYVIGAASGHQLVANGFGTTVIDSEVRNLSAGLLNRSGGCVVSDCVAKDSANSLDVTYSKALVSIRNTFVNCTTGGSLTNDLNQSIGDRLINCVLGAGVENNGYNNRDTSPPWALTISDKHDGGSGRKSFSLGGILTTQAVVVPDSRTQAYQIVLESATYYGFCDWDFTIDAGESLTFDVWLRQNEAALDNEPQWQLIDPANDPLVDSTKSPLASYAPDLDADTWYAGTLTYANPSATERLPVKLRLIGRDATATIYGEFDEPVRFQAAYDYGFSR